AGNTSIDGREYHCIVNIGSKPTYDIAEQTVEVHIVDFDGNLYGNKMSISLVRYLRPTCKFCDEVQLAQQLKIDRENCLND
ncbi:MAG: riboflavin kinase, partial [Clostridia bacterium]|nr:riboflavin kinase [Clostridia bacterium]